MIRPHPDDPVEFPAHLRRSIGKQREPAPAVSQPEAQTLSDVRAHCDTLRIEHFHIPGWLLSIFGKLALLVTVVLEHARDSAEEVRGFPDLILFYKGRYLALELKTEIGKMTTAQRIWQRRIGTIQCRGADETCTVIDEWVAVVDHG
jgi:hypothetical protein